MKVLNKKQFDKWAEERRKLQHDIVSKKGIVDGDYRNIAWQDVTTKEVFALEFDIK